MKKDKKTKIIAFVALAIGVLGLAIGFSALSSVLLIKSGASFKLNGEVFDVVFSSSATGVELNSINPKVVGDGIQASAATINNASLNPTISGLNVKFTNPGQKITYTFYASNVGGVNAYLNSIMYKNVSNGNNFKKCTGSPTADPGQVQLACNGISVSVKTGSINIKGSNSSIRDTAIPSKSNRKIEVTIEYDIESMKPNGDFAVDFGDIELVYGETQN